MRIAILLKIYFFSAQSCLKDKSCKTVVYLINVLKQQHNLHLYLINLISHTNVILLCAKHEVFNSRWLPRVSSHLHEAKTSDDGTKFNDIIVRDIIVISIEIFKNKRVEQNVLY